MLGQISPLYHGDGVLSAVAGLAHADDATFNAAHIRG